MIKKVFIELFMAAGVGFGVFISMYIADSSPSEIFSAIWFCATGCLIGRFFR